MRLMLRGETSPDLLVVALLELLPSLLFALALELLHHLRWAILNQVALIVETTPLWQTVRNVHDALAVEHMASAIKVSISTF